MVSEGRLCCRPPRLVRGVPLLVRMVVLLNGGARCVCVVPLSRVVPRLVSFVPSRVILLPVFSLCPAFLSFGMAVGVYHVSECCVGMTAMGSLSRSSSFF